MLEDKMLFLNCAGLTIKEQAIVFENLELEIAEGGKKIKYEC